MTDKPDERPFSVDEACKELKGKRLPSSLLGPDDFQLDGLQVSSGQQFVNAWNDQVRLPPRDVREFLTCAHPRFSDVELKVVFVLIEDTLALQIIDRETEGGEIAFSVGMVLGSGVINGSTAVILEEDRSDGAGRSIIVRMLAFFSLVGGTKFVGSVSGVGSYAWIALGFRPQPSEWPKVSDRLRTNIDAEIRNHFLAAALKKMIASEDPRSISRLAQALMRDQRSIIFETDWLGELDLAGISYDSALSEAKKVTRRWYQKILPWLFTNLKKS